MKKKIVKSKIAVRWEILKMVESLNQRYGDGVVDAKDVDFYKDNFQGNYIDLLFEKRIDPCQIWQVEILTKAKDADGNIHFHTLNFDLSEKMKLHDVLKGNDKIKFNKGGFKVKWKGITEMWLAEVDSDLKDMDCIEAWVTATCSAKVKPLSNFNFINKVIANKLI